MTITFDQTENVRPKTNVNLKVTADRGSDVNVLVVDKSVRLLKTGNDITQERVRFYSTLLKIFKGTPLIFSIGDNINPCPIYESCI